MNCTLLTSCNSRTGSGHFWRMTALLEILRENSEFPFTQLTLVSDFFPETFPHHLLGYSSNSLPLRGDICIRDMRDSSAELILKLRKIFTHIVTVDDSGNGDGISDASIKLLPTPEIPVPDITFSELPFLYGYHFYDSVLNLEGCFTKSIDLAIYTNQKEDELPFKISSLKKKFSIVLFYGNIITPLNHNASIDGYTALIASSRCILSHFGLTLYESAACHSLPIALNPSHYHSSLADSAASTGIVNCGTYSKTDYALLERSIISAPNAPVHSDQIQKTVSRQSDKFLTQLKKVL